MYALLCQSLRLDIVILLLACENLIALDLVLQMCDGAFLRFQLGIQALDHLAIGNPLFCGLWSEIGWVPGFRDLAHFS